MMLGWLYEFVLDKNCTSVTAIPSHACICLHKMSQYHPINSNPPLFQFPTKAYFMHCLTPNLGVPYFLHNYFFFIIQQGKAQFVVLLTDFLLVLKLLESHVHSRRAAEQQRFEDHMFSGNKYITGKVGYTLLSQEKVLVDVGTHHHQICSMFTPSSREKSPKQPSSKVLVDLSR